MNHADIRSQVKEVPNFPVDGVNFKDISGVISNTHTFEESIYWMHRAIRYRNIHAIVSPDARGWLFAAPVAERMRVPLHIARKTGKLPPPTVSIKYDYEYGSAELHLPQETSFTGMRVAVIDDVNATGSTAIALAKLCRQLGATHVEYVSLIDLPFLGGRDLLQNEHHVPTQWILEYTE